MTLESNLMAALYTVKEIELQNPTAAVAQNYEVREVAKGFYMIEDNKGNLIEKTQCHSLETTQ